MRSEFELGAKQAAVEAVERRYEMKAATERRARFRARLSACLSILILLAVLAGIACFVARYLNLDVPRFSDFSAWFSPGSALSESAKEELGRRDAYVRALMAFETGGELKMLRDAPADVKPKTARPGTRVLVLCGRDEGGTCLFEMEKMDAGTQVFRQLSPFSAPQKRKAARFQEAVAGRPYFLLHENVVYVCGAKDVEAGRAVLSGLLKVLH